MNRYAGKLCIATRQISISNVDGLPNPRRYLNLGDFIIPLSSFQFPFCEVLTRYGLAVVHLSAFVEVE